MNLRATILVVCMGFIGLGGCQNNSDNTQIPSETVNQKVEVTVSIVPQKYFVERIGGENVAVNVMVLPGANPELYEPKPEQLRSLAQSKIYFSIGLLPFEKTWLNRIKAANTEMKIVDTSSGLELQTLDHHHHHHEGEKENQEQESLDPHIWLSPKLVKIQANTIYQELANLDRENTPQYQQNLEKFIADIDKLDREINEKLSGLSNRKFIVFHPTWGYFAKDYKLEMIPIEIDGQEPSPRELTELITEAKEENIKVVFTQPEFSTSTAKIIAEQIEGEILLINPLAPNWLENMRQIAESMYQGLSKNKELSFNYK